MPNHILFSLLVSLGIGLLVGMERGWSKRSQVEGDRVAGIRTFGLVGLTGGVSAIIAQSSSHWYLIAAFLGITLLAVAGHILDFRKNRDVGITSTIAILLTFSLSAWAIYGNEIEAMGTAVVLTAILGLKPFLHKWLGKLNEKEVFAGLKLLIISVVFLPLLPDQGYGPYEAFNPYWIWLMVVLISGISFVGYFAIRIAGDRIGTLVTALVGALASSTAVTLSMGSLAVKSVDKRLFMSGVLIASSVMFARVLIEVSVVNSSLLKSMWLPIAAMALITASSGFWMWKTASKKEFKDEIEIKNPLDLKTALKFGLILVVVLFLSEWLSEVFGDQGLLMLAVLSGLTDVDAITLSYSQMAKENTSAEVAVKGIVLASISNTLVKAGIFAFYVGIKKSTQLIVFIAIAAAVGAGVLFLF